MLIAIDGPAGAGKSTVARALARELGFTYLDSGAMYRCVALAALESGSGALPEQPGALGPLARSVHIGFEDRPAEASPEGGGAPAGTEASCVLLDGRDVTAAIRAPAVSEAASVVAADAAVREALVAKQRELIGSGDWVAEGRDIGTVVAPAAELKIFLTADPRERARRRAGELDADVATVLAEQTMRDERDSAREHSPLRAAEDAVTLDTSGLSVEQVVQEIAALAEGRDGEATPADAVD